MVEVLALPEIWAPLEAAAAATGPILLCACNIFSAFAASARAVARFCVSCRSLAICADMVLRCVGVVIVRVVSWRSRVLSWARMGLLVIVDVDMDVEVGAMGEVVMEAELPMNDSRKARRASRAVAWVRIRFVCASRAAVLEDSLGAGFDDGSEATREGVGALACAVSVVVRT